jgi:hypothetical protein
MNSGIGSGPTNGVLVDAQGVLRNEVFDDPTGQLLRARVEGARAKLDKRVATPSKLRKISLNRLEAAVRDRLDKRQTPSDEMLHLAGLTRLQYVFFYPETKDVVIAGPSEAWAPDLSGRVRGVESGWTTLELQDLIVALRAFPPNGKASPVILISIDPRPEGLAAMKRFLHEVGREATPDDTDYIVDGLRNSLGMQNIRVQGIAPNTHFAQVLIEADYRMKLIGIGVEEPPIRIKSYVERANPGMISRNAMERWYFVPNYQCVRVAPEELGMQLVGNGVKLVSENEIVSQSGGRSATGHINKASKGFTDEFTQKYAQLAQVVPVYAQLRNCVDMAVAAAFIQAHGYYAKADWNMELFGDEQRYPVQTLNTPQQTETVVASVWRGNQLMTPVGGGVQMAPSQALVSTNLLTDEKGEVAKTRDAIRLDQLAPGQWWWD